MRSYFIVFFVFLLVACGPGNRNEKSIKEQIVEEGKVSHSATCYLYNQGNSEIYMDISIADNQVSGELIYELQEKNRSAGNLKGELFGDTLIASYSFLSEGIKSNREVAFLRTSDGWIQGNAELMKKNGTMLFRDRSQLKFNPKIILKEVKCR